MLALLAASLPNAQASVINIDELAGGGLALTIDGALITGNGGNVSAYSNDGETLSFTFTSAQAWANDTHQYQYLLGEGGVKSDLFTISGALGSFLNEIVFTSASAKLVTPSSPFTEYSPGIVENGNWQQVYASAGDTFFAKVEVPEPSVLSLFGLGLLGLCFGKRSRVTSAA